MYSITTSKKLRSRARNISRKLRSIGMDWSTSEVKEYMLSLSPERLSRLVLRSKRGGLSILDF